MLQELLSQKGQSQGIRRRVRRRHAYEQLEQTYEVFFESVGIHINNYTFEYCIYIRDSKLYDDYARFTAERSAHSRTGSLSKFI